jgi:glycosyltransferase involved in cell wall biosynthesis
MNNPLVSIIIPVYNGSNYLREAIDSALAQTYRNCEIIVVNDGSNDNGQTEEICISYGNKIRYFKKNNGGVSTALNFGIKEMRGEYFSWLSHDDIYYPEKISFQLEFLNKIMDMKRIVFGNFHFYNIKNNSNTLFNLEALCEPEKLTVGIYPALFGIIHACVMLIHKSHIDRVGGLDENLSTTQDADWIYRLLQGQETLFIDKPLIAVRLHDEQGKHHIENYNSEQTLTHISFLKNIKKQEIVQLFECEYMFFHQMATYYKHDKDMGAYEYAKKRFESLTPPDNIADSINKLKNKLKTLSQNNADKICIFCAGQFGRRLNSSLVQRDIRIDYFSDNNQGLWGSVIDGVKCICPKEIDKNNTLVIVALENPKLLLETFRADNFLYVFSYFDIISDITSTIPLIID